MRVYYLNNFILAQYTNCNIPIWFRSGHMISWIKTIIDDIKEAKQVHSDLFSTKFDLNLCFYNIIKSIEGLTDNKKIDYDVKRIFMTMLISNKDIIITLSETKEYYYIDMIEGRLVVIFPDE